LTDLDVITPVVITAFSKEPMSHYLVGIEFVKDRVGVLYIKYSGQREKRG